MTRLAFVLTTIILALTTVTIAAGQERQYSRWQSPETRLEKMINELDVLIQEAARQRAADPNFLYDLRKVLQQYKEPQRTIYLSDDFDDLDYNRNPAWQVLEGEFKIDGRGALFTRVRRQNAAGGNSSRDAGTNNLNVFLDILNEIAAEKQGGQQGASGAQSESMISTAAAIPNYFSLQFTLRSDAVRNGSLGVGLFQGSTIRSGYHLVYQPMPSADRPLQIIKYRDGIPYLVKSAGASSPDLDDGADHTVLWQRNLSGDMTVSIDGREVISASDQTYLQDFDGLVIINDGGEYGIDNILVYTER